jgi:histone H1/5
VHSCKARKNVILKREGNTVNVVATTNFSLPRPASELALGPVRAPERIHASLPASLHLFHSLHFIESDRKMADTASAPAAAQASPKKSAKAKKPRTTPAHPRTSEMVNNAIKNLKERGGSSLQAIKKYISQNYKVDSEKLAPFIKKYLRSAVVSGSLVQTKGKGASGSFKLSASTKPEGGVATKAKRSAPKEKKPTKKAAGAKRPKKTGEKKKAAVAKPRKSPSKVKKAKTPKKPKAPKPKKATAKPKTAKRAAPKKK